MRSVAPFLMFTGRAEEALRFYTATFPRSEIISIVRHDGSGPGAAGTVSQGRMRIGELELVMADSPPIHAFSFTPSVSFLVECESAAELRTIAEPLAAGGQTFMALERYPFAELFTWLSDRFGVSWQLSLKASAA